MTAFLFAIAIILLTALSQFLMRFAVAQPARQKLFYIAPAYLLYLVIVLISIAFLSLADLKYMAVIMAANYITGYVIGVHYFKESNSRFKNIGIGLIVAGASVFWF